MSLAIEWLAFSSWQLGVSILVVICLRPIARIAFGSAVAYLLWLVPLSVLCIAAFIPAAPGPIEWVQDGVQLQEVVTTDSPTYWMTYVLAAWLLGAVVSVAILFLRQYLFCKRLGTLREKGTFEAVGVFESPHATSAMAFGLWTPQIVVPKGFFSIDEHSRELILRHEREHLRRHDPKVNLVAECFRAIFWFHPLVHLGIYYFRFDQETACDERVLRYRFGSRRSYASALIDSMDGKTLLVANSWASPKQLLSKRIKLLMHPPRLPLVRIAGIGLICGLLGYIATSTYDSRPTSGVQRMPMDQQAQIIAGMDSNALGINLLQAASSRDYRLAEVLLESGSPVNYGKPDIGTPLIVAARQGDVELARLLLNHDADVNGAVVTAGSPLIVAAKHNNLEMAKFLIGKGGDVNAHVFLDETPLINASRFGNLEMVNLLIESTADVRKSVRTLSITHLPLGKKSPLSEALRVGHDDVVRALQQHDS